MTDPVRSLSPELKADSLPHLSPRLAVPDYDRDRLTPSVVHLGVGNFHRAHQAAYFDDLARLGSTGWGLTGSGLRSRTMKDALQAQDCLYTLVERGAGGDSARVIGAMQRFLYGPEESRALVNALADQRTRLVMLTLTAEGYPLRAGRLDFSHRDIVEDLACPERPSSAIGYLVEALARRRRAGTAPFTVMSCDNLDDNGKAARTCVVDLAERRDPALARWIKRNVAFPSTMVDRITPTVSRADRAWVQRRFGVQDLCPVITEPFSHWVVADEFSDLRPPLDDVGVEFVSDVRPHKRAKMSLLNGSHCALGYLGFLSGHETTDQALRDPLIRELVERLMATEVAPLLEQPRGLDLVAYQQSLLQRFANPSLADPLSRLCRRGSVRMPDYLLPSLESALRARRPHAMLTFVVAAWIRYLRGTDLSGRAIAIADPQRDELVRRAAGPDAVRQLLSMTEIFGGLRSYPAFVRSLERAVAEIDRRGLRATMSTHVTELTQGGASAEAS